MTDFKAFRCKLKLMLKVERASVKQWLFSKTNISFIKSQMRK